MTTALLFALWTSSAYYLGAWATITRPLWSRYPAWLTAMTGCAACSGFWYGAFAGAVGLRLELDYLGVRGWPMIPAAAIASVVTTPLAGWLLLKAMHAIPEPQ